MSQDSSKKKTQSPRTLGSMEGIKPLCPVCGRELSEEQYKNGEWECTCGESIPEGLIIDPFSGCTHGLNCNCGRERRG